VRWIEIATPATPINNFAIVVDGAAVGGIGLMLKEDVFRRSAEIGYWLGEEFWGHGIVTEAVRAVTRYAFDTFDICRVFAGVFEWNPASMRVLEKAGYEFECRMRKSVTKDGETIDEFIYAVVR
jgi:RimJ/RimL family protein N-acetyltransferase